MNREHKIHEGQVLLNDVNNYRPLDEPMVGTTAKKVQRVIKSLLQENHIDDMTAKWLSLTPNPPRIPVSLVSIPTYHKRKVSTLYVKHTKNFIRGIPPYQSGTLEKCSV